MNENDDETGLQIFEEPEDFYQSPPDPTFEIYEREKQFVRNGEPSEISMRLVGKSPLWGHLLWNAGKLTTYCIDKNRHEWIDGKTVLELGAAAALPSLLAALSAELVVSTDYPDPDLLENIQFNVDLLKEQVVKTNSSIQLAPVQVKGYRWGAPVEEMWDGGLNKFDFIIMSDLIFNHSEHTRLIESCKQCIVPNTGRVFVVFTPHRPKLFDMDLSFFELAEQHGFTVEKYMEKKMTPMFEEDDDEQSKHYRSMVYAYIMKLPSSK